MPTHLYKTIDSVFYNKIDIKRSKFIAYIVPYSLFGEYKIKLRKENPKASHIVYAYRYLENGRVEEAFSDDGEPKGCAGMPLLKVMRGWDLVDCAILIVRYFGGIKLGTGGMVRAYSQAAQELLHNITLIEYIEKKSFIFTTKYDDIRKVEYLCKNSDIEIVSRDFKEQSVEWELRGSSMDLEKLKSLDSIKSRQS